MLPVSELDLVEPLRHEPLRRPRAGFYGECLFSAAWGRLAGMHVRNEDCEYSEDRTVLEEILDMYPLNVRQREATVAASFVTWLGTNSGRGFIVEGRKLGKLLNNRRNGFNAAWAIENKRILGVNNHIRTIEAIMTPEAVSRTPDMFARGGSQIPALTVQDTEVVDCIVDWLGSDHGTQFLNDCLLQIEMMSTAQRKEQSKDSRNQMDSALQ